MKRFLLPCAMASIIMVYGNNLSAQNLTDNQRNSIENALDSLFTDAVKAAEKFDMQKLASVIDDRHNAGFIVNGIYFNTFDKLMMEQMMKIEGVKSQNIEVSGKKISILDDDHALLTAYGKAIILLTDGNSFDNRFVWSFLYEKIDGKWKVIHSHQSSAK